ncbi:hypothetical protein ACIPUD_38850 [Bradyrhizobium sp. CAR08]
MVSTIAVIALVGIFVFLLLRRSPGDPAAIAGDNAAPQMIAGIRENLGLNKPLPIQFVHWMMGMFVGDFGASVFAGDQLSNSFRNDWSRPFRWRSSRRLLR